MPVYAIAQGLLHDRAKHDKYVAAAVPTLPQEAKVLVFDLEPEVVEGPVTHPRTVILEFPTREAFRAWYESPAYQAVLGLRLQSVTGTFVLAKGFVSPES
jgi:uncharacterized protein (DUF1330 family)